MSEDVGSVELCVVLEAARLTETLTVLLEVGGSTGSKQAIVHSPLSLLCTLSLSLALSCTLLHALSPSLSLL